MNKTPVFTPPPSDCPLCLRLVSFRETWRAREPHWHNAPVPSFGPADAALLIVGLAPGLQGANRTGRPFTGDYAGNLLYATLAEFGFSQGTYDEHPDDGLELINARISNAVRCVPPENKPTTDEIKTCRQFLVAELSTLKNLRAIVALGTVAHNSVVAAFGGRASAYRFAHGAEHEINGLRLFDSYHCSRYNTNTGRLTTEMFHAVFARVRIFLEKP